MRSEATKRCEYLGDSLRSSLSQLTQQQLRDALVARSLDSKGKKSELVARLKEDNAFALELMSEAGGGGRDGYKTVEDALNAAREKGGETARILEEVKMKR